jgi:hypothetical protein
MERRFDEWNTHHHYRLFENIRFSAKKFRRMKLTPAFFIAFVPSGVILSWVIGSTFGGKSGNLFKPALFKPGAPFGQWSICTVNRSPMSRSTLQTGHFMLKPRDYNCEDKGFLMERYFSILPRKSIC